MMKKHIVIAVSAILLFGGLFLYMIQNFRKQPNQEVDTNTQTTVQDTQTDNTEVSQSEAYPQHIEAIAGTDEVWYHIPELGIRMRLNKEFAEDLIYKQNSYADSVGFDGVDVSTKSVTAIDKGCSPEVDVVLGGADGVLGAVFREKGNVRELAQTDEYIAARVDQYIQIGDYYYGWSGPQAICWNPKSEEKVRTVFPGTYHGTGAKTVSEAIKTIQLIPQTK